MGMVEGCQCLNSQQVGYLQGKRITILPLHVLDAAALFVT